MRQAIARLYGFSIPGGIRQPGHDQPLLHRLAHRHIEHLGSSQARGAGAVEYRSQIG
jgi:hypothetical protein